MADGIMNTVVIHRPPDVVFDHCTRLERWSDIFPGCTDVTYEWLSPKDVVMEMTIANSLGKNRVRSRRTYNPALRHIDFTLETIPTSPGTVTGRWAMKEVDEGTALTVTHLFRPDSSLSPEEGKRLTDHLHANMHANTEDALEALKLFAERSA